MNHGVRCAPNTRHSNCRFRGIIEFGNDPLQSFDFLDSIRHLTRFATFVAAISLVGCASTEPRLSDARSTVYENAPFEVGRSCFAGVRSSYDDWAASVISNNEGASLDTFQMRFPRANYDAYKEALDCNFIAYPVGDLTIRGIYVRPKDREGEDLPVLIVNRGGNGPSGAWNFRSLFQRVLPVSNAGYIVIGSQYRGSRRGGDPSIYGSDEFGGEDINDVLALLDLIDRLPGADGSRIGMYGWSRGGFMALMVATRTERLKAMAVGGTPTDLAAELAIRPQMERVFRARIPNYDEDKDAALEARSAVRWADAIDADLPILILHGEHDDRVSLNSAQQLAEVLQELERPHQLVTYEAGSHGLLERNAEVINELVAWFNAYLVETENQH